MIAILAAIMFGLALLLQMTSTSFGNVITAATLTSAGLLCVALHLAGVATAIPRYRRRR